MLDKCCLRVSVTKTSELFRITVFISEKKGRPALRKPGLLTALSDLPLFWYRLGLIYTACFISVFRFARSTCKCNTWCLDSICLQKMAETSLQHLSEMQCRPGQGAGCPMVRWEKIKTWCVFKDQQVWPGSQGALAVLFWPGRSGSPGDVNPPSTRRFPSSFPPQQLEMVRDVNCCLINWLIFSSGIVGEKLHWVIYTFIWSVSFIC